MDRELKTLLEDEAGIKMSDELFGHFTAGTTEIHLKNKDILVPYGKLDTNVYLLKSGIIKYDYFDGEREKTYGFANPGTAMISYHSFHGREPSFFQLEACCDSVVLRLPKRKVDELMGSSLEFARWLLAVQFAQLYINEHKLAVISGAAKERYLALIEKRPEIISNVSAQTIASYLGIDPTYLSYIKKTLRKNRRS